MEPAAAAAESEPSDRPELARTVEIMEPSPKVEMSGTYRGIGTFRPPSSSGGAQAFEFESAADTGHSDPTDSVFDFYDALMKMESHSEMIWGLKESTLELDADAALRVKKIHKFPAIIRDPDRRYTTPRVVVIGPYHHHLRGKLKHAEKMKRVAAYQLMLSSRIPAREVFNSVIRVACDARRLYDMDKMEGIGNDVFLPMMFLDACFLVQFMRSMLPNLPRMEKSLISFFVSNRDHIYDDIMLLENQLPWPVVMATMKCTFLEEFIVCCLKNCLKDRNFGQETPFVLDDRYEPPHLLGLLLFCIVERRKKKLITLHKEAEGSSLFVSLHDLEEMGISLKATETIDLTDMGFKKKWPFFAELRMSPLQLNARPSWLINMAALEMCMRPDFQDETDGNSVVCSYLNLFTMLVHSEADVYDLRKKRLLQGGGGYTDKEMVDLFACLQSLRHGNQYLDIMAKIKDYKKEKWWLIKIYIFFCRNMKIITTFCSAIIALIGVLKTLQSLKFI